MDKESLITLLEHFVDEMIKYSDKAMKIVGPRVKEVKENIYQTIIEFYLILSEQEKPVKLMSLKYMFDLTIMKDEDVFNSIGASINEARYKILEEIARLMFEATDAGTLGNSYKDSQKDYVV